MPSVYLAANDALSKGGYANRDFLYALLDHAYGVDNLPYGCAPVYRRDTVLENLTMRTARIYTTLILTVPVCVAAVGLVIVTRRKNR